MTKKKLTLCQTHCIRNSSHWSFMSWENDTYLVLEMSKWEVGSVSGDYLCVCYFLTWWWGTCCFFSFLSSWLSLSSLFCCCCWRRCCCCCHRRCCCCCCLYHCNLFCYCSCWSCFQSCTFRWRCVCLFLQIRFVVILFTSSLSSHVLLAISVKFCQKLLFNLMDSKIH